MQRYLLQRLLATIPILVMVAVISFFLIDLAPGDAAAIIAGDQATPQEVEQMRRELGMDQPAVVRFGWWVNDLAHGDLGVSVFTRKSITSLLAPRIEPTVSLTITASILSILLGIPIGVVAAWKRGSLIDRGIMAFATLGFSVPSFWLGFIFIWVFAVKLPWFPSIGFVGIFESVPGFFRSVTLPSVSLAIFGATFLARMTRSSMLEVLGEDYVRTARAKGLRESVVLVRHALKPGSLPVVTVIGLLFAAFLTGVVVIETVFTIPGLGRLVADAVASRDYPVIQSLLMLLAAIYVFINLAIDILYAYLDPRIRY